MNFTLTGQAGERNDFIEAFEEFCRQRQVPSSVRQAADVALEEHLTNVLNHGFDPGSKPQVVVRLELADNQLEVEVEDTGKSFNPLAAPPVDISLPLEEKPIGGLGVHLMREYMDDLAYARIDNRNVLRMIKRYPPSANT